MNITESIRVAVGALTANKLRSILTMLGIIIGVGAVITLVSVGQGVEKMVTDSIQGIGSNLLFVIPSDPEGSSGGGMGMGSSPRSLTYADAQAIADPLNVPDVVAVAPETMGFAEVVYRNKDTETYVSGITPEYGEVRNFYPEFGRFISAEDLVGRSRVAVLGQTVVEDLFPEGAYPIDQVIKINQVPFKVIGVMEEKGGSGFGGDEDDVIFVPLTTAQARLFSGRRNRSGEHTVSDIYVQVADEERIEATMDDITELLRARHKIQFRDEDDFSVINQADIVSFASDIFGVLTLYLGAISAISLLVGGIGIMNIMLVSVTERTREIGIRKAVGAKRRDILLQFLIESMVMSLIGGLIGMGLGFVGSLAVSGLAENLETAVTPGAILLATGFSMAVGLFFGIYPATRAAQLNPIEALRYE
jgi:putative ABC transport system permease protein